MEGNYQGEQQYNQQPYGTEQQYNQQSYGTEQQYNQQPYSNQQLYGSQQYNQQPYVQQMPYSQPAGYEVLPKNHGGVAIASLICGIMGIVFCWLPIVDLGVNIAGLVCAIITLSKRYDGKGMAIGGLITSIIGLLLSILFMFWYAVFGALLM